MLKINKQLQRFDGGDVAAGSILNWNYRIDKKNSSVNFLMVHYFNQTAMDEKKKPMPGVLDFPCRMVKICTPTQFKSLTPKKSDELAEKWLIQLLDKKIGVGNVEIIKTLEDDGDTI